ncbi:ABC transporter substrate-binding protein [Paenibacillus agricola]|uniref:Extracellular solute-binding protein n=1 Tax=Paenibacillus agricola TaxID=2716264 RepID=A0ABX0JBM7_9BACL|nr:extracellular solute-binding protein [Paenibacillus agricola]NHN32671.1 extracellular solute-binding protein [Paenibacillus agricola]
MRAIKKLNSVFAVTMCLGLVVGCSATPVAQTASSEKVEFTFSFWGNTDEKESYNKLIEEYNKAHPNVTVKPMYIPDDYSTKLNALASSNTLPDIAKIQAGQVFPWSKSGKFVDVEPMHKTGDIAKKLEYTGFKNSSGKVIGYSSNNEIIIMYYNKEIFDDAKLPYPPASADKAWTWDQFVEVAKKLTKDKNGKSPGESGFDGENITTYGTNMILNGNSIQPLLYSNNGGIVSPDGKIILDSPESIAALQQIADLANKHSVMPKPSQSAAIPSADAALLTKRVAMVIDGQWSLQVLGKAMAEKGLKLGVAVLPKFQIAVTTNTGSAIEIITTENSKKHMKEAQEFYKFVMDPSNIFPLIENGLAMPNEEKWFTDPALVKKWVDNKYHPAEYKTAVVDYGLNNVKQPSGFFWENDVKASSIIYPALDQLWLGKKTAEEVVKKDIMPKLKQELEIK